MPKDEKNKTIAIVTYPGVALLDLVATKTIFDRLAMGTRYRAVSVEERTEPMDSNTPMAIILEKRFEEVPEARARLSESRRKELLLDGDIVCGLRPAKSH